MDLIQKTAAAEEIFVAYTAGSCLQNYGPGGCAYLVYAPCGGRPDEFSRGGQNTTNNRAELQAVIELLKRTCASVSLQICLSSDYVRVGLEEYVPGWLTNGWRTSQGKAVANEDKWVELLALLEDRKVLFEKVSDSEGNAGRQRAKELARIAAEGAQRRHAARPFGEA